MTTNLPPKKFTNVNGRRLAHVEMGRGEPIQQEVPVPGLHFIQEDSGAAIGAAVAAWLSQLD